MSRKHTADDYLVIAIALVAELVDGPIGASIVLPGRDDDYTGARKGESITVYGNGATFQVEIDGVLFEVGFEEHGRMRRKR